MVQGMPPVFWPRLQKSMPQAWNAFFRHIFRRCRRRPTPKLLTLELTDSTNSIRSASRRKREHACFPMKISAKVSWLLSLVPCNIRPPTPLALDVFLSSGMSNSESLHCHTLFHSFCDRHVSVRTHSHEPPGCCLELHLERWHYWRVSRHRAETKNSWPTREHGFN